MENCSVTIANSKVGIELTKLIGNNEILKTTIYLTAVTNDSFTDEFIKWYKEANKSNETPNLFTDDGRTAAKIARNIQNYYYSKNPSVSASTRINTSNDYVKRYNYTSTFEREAGKRHVAKFILKSFINLNKQGIEIKGNKFKDYTNRVRTIWKNLIFDYITNLTGKDRSAIIAGYIEAQDSTEYLDKLLGGKLKSATAQNLLAVYKELFSTEEHIKTYMTEVFANTKLTNVLHQIRDDIDEKVYKELAEQASNELGFDSANTYDDAKADEPDTTYTKTDHSGIYSSYLTHIGSRIRDYFNSLEKLATPTIGDKDTFNTYGIAETMDANACTSIMYNHGVNFRSIDSMIESIDRIGRTVKGFEAFVQFAQDLKDDDDLATEVFTVFAKPKIRRIETIVENGEAKTDVSNKRAFRDSVFIFDLMNDVKSSILNNVGDILASQVQNVYNDIAETNGFVKLINDEYIDSDTIKDSKLEIDKLIGKLKLSTIKLLKSCYPSIEDNAILSYIELNNDANGDYKQILTNITHLVSTIKATANKLDAANTMYNQILAKAADIKEYNDRLKEEADRSNRWLDQSKLKSTKEVYSDDYISPLYGTILSLSRMLLPYSVVNTDFNSRNIHGNNNSDIINSSHITNLSKMLEDTYVDEIGRLRNETLEKWGIDKLKSKQYKYSNLLVEQVDPITKEVLNEGLAIFRWSNGQLCLTENADKILKVNLFNGASNIDDAVNASYAEMTMGTYLPTSFINFFKTIDRDVKSLPIATYFTRTPSDASKIFCITAPRHDTSNLFKLVDSDKFKKDVRNIVELVGRGTTINPYIELYRNNRVNKNESAEQEIDDIQLEDYLFPVKHILISDARAIKPVTEPDKNGNFEGYFTVKTKSGAGAILYGNISKAGKGQAIDNALLVGTIDFNNPTSNELHEHIDGILSRRYSDELLQHDVTIGDITFHAERVVNTNDKVFKMIKNQFKQELLDMAIALNHYFEVEEYHTENEYSSEEGESNSRIYRLKLGTGKNGKIIPVFREGQSNTKGYEFYHLGKDGKVYSETATGLNFGGAVFHSKKFTLVQIDEKGKVYEKNYLDKLIVNDKVTKEDNGVISFLYGGALQLVIDDNGVVVDVQLTQNQERAIDDAISEFIKDYREQAITEVERYSGFIKGVTVNADTITEYAMNQLLMHYTYDELLEGSSKFYIDTQIMLKRIKEYQASGVPYGIANYEAGFKPTMAPIKTHSFLNNGFTTRVVRETYVDNNGATRIRDKKDDNGEVVTEEISIQKLFEDAGFHVEQRYGFQAVTVKNTKSTNHKALQSLARKLQKECNLSKDEALDLLYGPIQTDEKGNPKIDEETGEVIRKGGFTETKVNDAQSYITFEEWVRRIAARGQLQRYLPLIKKLIDPHSRLTTSDLKEFVQVQKNVYYDMYYDDKYGIEVPRFIKNAEFVLIPRLIKGTQLEKVYYAMKDAGIDQLNTKETSKAANEEVLTLWDNDGNLIEDVIKEFVNEASNVKQIYSYNNLYTQQETPQHMNAQNKAGIQIVKKIMDNLPNDDSSLGRLKKEYFRLFSTNVAESCAKLLKEFEIPVDDNGNIDLNDDGTIKGINMKVFYNKLKEEMLRLGMDSNAMDYVTIPNGETEPLMPAYRNNLITKFESIVQSLFNHGITRQKLPGFHAAQVTNVGWKAMSDDIDSVSYSKELQYHPDEFRNKENPREVISKRKYDKLSREEQAKYENAGPASYIEVMLPASFLGIDKRSAHYKGMTDEQILEELAKEQLDTIIGYRIPTEGKQSVCVMKVVGFVDDSYGSTIIVPNDWVSQTGSDFDIDSVYGIQYETYKTKDGQIKKIPYKKDVNQYDWFRYLLNYTEEKDNDEASENIKSAKEKIKNLINDRLDKQQDDRNKLWKELLNAEQQIIKFAQAEAYKEVSKYNVTGLDAKITRISLELEYLTNLINNNKAKFPSIADNLEKYKQLVKITYDFLKAKTGEYTDVVKKEIDDLISEEKGSLTSIAENSGLMTLEEFTDPKNIDKANGSAGRNSRIFEIMVEILSDPASLEENLSRSNFDDITFNKNLVASENEKLARKYRSPYNCFDQMRYQEEAMSGAKLKAFSVTLDTFCSICNTVRPTLTRPIYVIYDTKDIKETTKAEKRFRTKVSKDGASLPVRHNTYGWSSDNRNIIGKLITVYSSETTAHILDNIKEGSIPNENDYTFSVLKTFVNAGSDYKTTIAFITQPAVTRIVNAYNTNNSVYASSSNNPIHQAIAEIASELGINVLNENITFREVNKSIAEILTLLNAKYKEEFNKMFRQEGDPELEISLDSDNLANLPIIVSKLMDRINERGQFSNASSPVEKLLFDLGVALTFSYIHETANTIGDYARCCNPDKFGAKQTVFETRQVFKSLHDLLYKTEQIDVPTEDGEETIITNTAKPAYLTVGDKHILASIYPGIDNPNFDLEDLIKHIVHTANIEDSSYPTLFAFLKYASATSVVAAKTIFPTQQKEFVDLVEGITSVFSGYNPTLTEEVYNDFQKYVLGSIDNNCPSIKYPIKVRTNSKTGISVTWGVDFDPTKIENQNEVVANNETMRIYGYNRSPEIATYEQKIIKQSDGKIIRRRNKIPFTVIDPNNPKEEELELFEQLSPAQKIYWIKQTFTDSGIFNYIRVNLRNPAIRGKKAGMQTLEYTEQNVDSNVIYAMFNEAFYSTNPLIMSAAIDIVKYAVQVEGMRMSATAVNKVIDNDCLYHEFGIDGLGVIANAKQQLSSIATRKGEWATDERKEKLYENYLRSHPESKSISSFNVTARNRRTFGLYKQAYGTYFLAKGSDRKTDEANKLEFDKKLKRLGIKYYLPFSNRYVTNKYVRLVENKVSTLYKIKDYGDYVILYPLGNLEANENSEWSSNENNNDFLISYAYEMLCADFALDVQANSFNSKWIIDKIKTYKEEKKTKDFWYKKRKIFYDGTPAAPFDIEELAKKGGSFSILRDEIIRHFSDPLAGVLYIKNIDIEHYIFSPGVEFGSTQTIKFGPNNSKSFNIFIPEELSTYEKNYLKQNKNEVKTDSDRIKNDSLRKIIKNAQANNIKKLNGVVAVVPNQSFAASKEELISSNIDFAIARKAGRPVYNPVTKQYETNTINSEYLGKLKENEISVNIESIKNNPEIAIRETAKYARRTSIFIKDLFNNFVPDPDKIEGYMSITDPEVQALIKQDEHLANRYLEACNMAEAFIRDYEEYDSLNIEAEDAQTKRFIEDIRKSLKDIRELPTKDLANKYAETIVDKISTDPLIKEGLIDVFDGFWRAYGGMWMFNDIMENGTPILQVILKEVMGDIDAKRMMTDRARKAFRKHIKDLIKAAAAAGYIIDFDKIIGKDNRFVHTYNSSFVDKITELKENIENTIAKNGIGSEAHLRAKLDFDEFVAKHCNQEAKPEYYKQRCEIERYMLDNYPKLYSEYMKLYYRRSELYSSVTSDGFSDEELKELKRIDKEMFNLTNLPYYLSDINDGTSMVHRPIYDSNAAYTEEELEEINFRGVVAVETLNEALERLKNLNEEYFEYESVYGFDDQLRINLNIIASFENPDGNGIPQNPIDQYENNPKYREAKDWIDKNAKFEFDLNRNAEGKRTGLKARLEEAFGRLGLTGKAQDSGISDFYKEINKDKGIRDERGIPDGRKVANYSYQTPTFDGGTVTTEGLAKVKSMQQISFYHGLGAYDKDYDLILISNAKPNNAVFNEAFYAKLSGNGKLNGQYLKVVTELNKILEKYVSAIDGNVHLELIEDTPEGIEELKTIATYYQKLRSLDKRVNSTNGAEVKKFIENNVEYVLNEQVWIAQNTAAMEKSQDYQDAWNLVAYERDADGDFKQNKDGLFIANKFLYSYAKPKGEPGDASYDKWVAGIAQEDLNLIRQIYKKVPTKYYYIAMHEAMDRAAKDPQHFSYMDWYIKNHVYNPYTRKMEPLDCWVSSEIRSELFVDGTLKGGHYVPRSSQRERKVKTGEHKVKLGKSERIIHHANEDMRNHDYDKDLGLVGNYIEGSGNGEYDSKVNLNPYEIQMRDYLEQTLMQTATTPQAKNYFKHGYLPRDKKPEPNTALSTIKEGLKVAGIGLTINNGKGLWYKEIGYEFDKTPIMPMTQVLDNKQTIDLTAKLKALKDNEIQPESCVTEEEYNTKVKEREEAIARLEEQIKAERNAITNRDWVNVIDCYLAQAGRYNAILDNKQKLYFLLNFIRNMKMYSREYGFTGKLKKDLRKDPEGKIYEETVDENLIKQLENSIRRLLYDQWKENQGGLTKVFNNLQGFASANYMMLNARGGIANVTLGETGILAEAAAKDFFGPKHWAFGTKQWTKGIISYGRSGWDSMFNHTNVSYSKQDAIIKHFNVVDYDETTGVYRDLTLKDYTKKFRDAMYSPQTMGEHFLQNSVLFAMLASHKLIQISANEMTYMSKSQYIAYKQAELLEQEILSPEQIKSFKEFKDKIKADKDVLAEYAWRRKDALTEWRYIHCNEKQIQDFIAKYEAQAKKLEEEFDSKQSMYDQLELGADGHMAIIEGTDLSKLDKLPANNVSEMTQAIELLGRFAEKVRKVNNRIHGIYNRHGSAYIEKEWHGGVVMQYHKHIPMGLLKRYMARGHWNETRGSVDKGMVQTIADIASLNFRKIKAEAGLTEEQEGALKSFVFLMLHLHNYIGQLKTTLKVIPAYEKANLLRNTGDAVGTVAAMLTVAALWAISDDDEEMQDELWFNLALYEADRLASEAFMYNPWGMINEGKKLMSTPIAAQSVVTDMASSLKAIGEWMLDDEYDPYYQTGRFAGEPKLWVYIQRRTPIWNGIRGILDTPSNNHYYKLGETPLTGLNLKERIQGED